ncbi:MAG TPA: ABC transporter ATP-binding protein [Gammaproteobacteria bacterium]|nr:ABC transporter ATP-binding protein [Gammaproteobacteria bacterium]
MRSLLVVNDLRVAYPAGKSDEKVVVDGLSFSLAAGGTLAIVGESGAGKSQALLALFDLLPPSARISGQRVFAGESVGDLTPAQRNHLRGSQVGYVFQDPTNTLNPYLTVGRQIGEVLKLQQGITGSTARERAVALLKMVELPDPADKLRCYPHVLSGGMQQRVMLAMALANQPQLLIADEPTTALDVTVQAGILALLHKLCCQQGIALLLVTHDLAVAQLVCDELLVMQQGRCVEHGAMDQLLHAPQHALTQSLVTAARREALPL